jgi:hypothetical protein
VSAPLPSETPRFAEQSPSAVIINCELASELRGETFEAIRASLSGVPILDLAGHGADTGDCTADGHVGPPHAIADILDWLRLASGHAPTRRH